MAFKDSWIRLACSLPFLVLLALLPLDAVGQDVTGPTVTVDLEVIDGDSGEPLENVVVRIPELDRYLLTDSLGTASLIDIDIGSYRLILTRMGYEARRGEFTVNRSGSFRMALTRVLVSLDSEPGEVVGLVLDPETREGIEAAEVSVAGLIRRVTDERGWFVMGVPAGTHSIEVSYLGRETVRDSIFVPEGQTLQVEIPLPVEAIELAGITVTTHPRFLSQAGFFRRQRQAGAFRGQQWTAEELAELDPVSLKDVLVEIPRINRVPPAAGEGSLVRLAAPGGCPLWVYVDDFPMDDWFDLDQIDPRRVAALEVYHRQNRPYPTNDGLPPRYVVTGCGVILVWLKRR